MFFKLKRKKDVISQTSQPQETPKELNTQINVNMHVAKPHYAEEEEKKVNC
jgi:hypothetical protein